jgi:hypothetical protein
MTVKTIENCLCFIRGNIKDKNEEVHKDMLGHI